MFWTENLQSLAVGLALGVVHVAEESGGAAERIIQINNGAVQKAKFFPKTQQHSITLTPLFLWDTWNQRMSDSHTVEKHFRSSFLEVD